jgi:hypothetical protein
MLKQLKTLRHCCLGTLKQEKWLVETVGSLSAYDGSVLKAGYRTSSINELKKNVEGLSVKFSLRKNFLKFSRFGRYLLLYFNIIIISCAIMKQRSLAWIFQQLKT